MYRVYDKETIFHGISFGTTNRKMLTVFKEWYRLAKAALPPAAEDRQQLETEEGHPVVGSS